MEKRYPWVKVTFLTCFVFVGLYVITYFITAVSYSLFSSEPADNSRGISWVYYSVMFSTLPYFAMGFLMNIYVKRRTLILTTQVVGIGFLLEKVVFVYFGTLLGTGYPWYGRSFPRSGYAVLCEELPMFCRVDYISSYHTWGTIIALGAFYFGSRIAFTVIKRIESSELI